MQLKLFAYLWPDILARKKGASLPKTDKKLPSNMAQILN
jgi:hypothetical protein